MISGMHHAASVDKSTEKFDIILHYNQTRIGVDLLDKSAQTIPFPIEHEDDLPILPNIGRNSLQNRI